MEYSSLVMLLLGTFLIVIKYYKLMETSLMKIFLLFERKSITSYTSTFSANLVYINSHSIHIMLMSLLHCCLLTMKLYIFFIFRNVWFPNETWYFNINHLKKDVTSLFFDIKLFFTVITMIYIHTSYLSTSGKNWS